MFLLVSWAVHLLEILELLVFCTSTDAMCAVCTGHHSRRGNSEIVAKRPNTHTQRTKPSPKNTQKRPTPKNKTCVSTNLIGPCVLSSSQVIWCVFLLIAIALQAWRGPACHESAGPQRVQMALQLQLERWSLCSTSSD